MPIFFFLILSNLVINRLDAAKLNYKVVLMVTFIKLNEIRQALFNILKTAYLI